MSPVWYCKAFAALSLDELYQIMQVRLRVFILEQACLYQDLDGKDEKSHHLFATNPNGEVEAYARLLPAGVSYDEVSFGRVLVGSHARGTGLGKALAKHCILEIERIFGHVPIRISAQRYLKQFYERYGFVQFSEEYEEDGIPHIQMLRSPNGK